MTPLEQELLHPCKTCKRGHSYSSDLPQCPDCKKESLTRWMTKNRGYISKKKKERYEVNRDAHIARVSEWKSRNYERCRERQRQKRNSDKEHFLAVEMDRRRKNRERGIWNGMIQRCGDPEHPMYKRYGGRGIKVCESWMTFENFIKDMGKRPSVHHSIDRRNNDKGYSPDNCYWATRSQQARNTSRNRYFEFNGMNMCMADWAKELGITSSLLWTRHSRGWPIERLLTTGPYIHS